MSGHDGGSDGNRAPGHPHPMDAEHHAALMLAQDGMVGPSMAAMQQGHITQTQQPMFGTPNFAGPLQSPTALLYPAATQQLQQPAQQQAHPAQRPRSSVFAPVCDTCRAHRCPPIKAAALGHFGCLQCLHQQGRVVGVRDDTGATPLHAAVGNGHLECAMWLVDRTGADLFAKDGTGSMPVHHAAYHGHLPCLKWLVEETNGDAATANSSDGATAVHFAAAKGNIECLQWLSSPEGGGSANDVDFNGATPLYFAAQEGRTACVQWLMEQGASPYEQAHDGMCPVHAAAQAGQVGTLRLMLTRSKPPSGQLANVKDRDGASPLHFAASKGHLECVQLLVDTFDLTGDEKDAIGATPVHDAAEHGHLNVLEFFAMRGTQLTCVDDEMLTPRKIAYQAGHVACANFLAQAIARRERGEPEPDWLSARATDATPASGGSHGQQPQPRLQQKNTPSASSPLPFSTPKQQQDEVEEEEEEDGLPAPQHTPSSTAAEKEGRSSTDGEEDRQSRLERHMQSASEEEDELRQALESLQQHMAKMAAVSLQLEGMAQSQGDGTSPKSSTPSSSSPSISATGIPRSGAQPPVSTAESQRQTAGVSPSTGSGGLRSTAAPHAAAPQQEQKPRRETGSKDKNKRNKRKKTKSQQARSQAAAAGSKFAKAKGASGARAELLSPGKAQQAPAVTPQRLQHKLQQQQQKQQGGSTPPVIRSKRLAKAQRTSSRAADDVQRLREREERLRREIRAAEKAAKAARQEQQQLQQHEARRQQHSAMSKDQKKSSASHNTVPAMAASSAHLGVPQQWDAVSSAPDSPAPLSLSKSASRRHGRSS